MDWLPRDTMPANTRVLIWVAGRIGHGVQFGSCYRLSDGRMVAKPEGGNGNWTDDITHWMPLPPAPDAASADKQVGMERTAEPGA